MYPIMSLQQLKEHNLDEIKAYKANANARKAELVAAKSKGGKAWTAELQKELDEIVVFLVDIDEAIAEKQKVETVAAEVSSSTSYEVKPGTEKMVHLSIVRGRRFNPMTGKEESKPFIQLFTFAEWQLFKKNFKGLGYTIMEVLNDPYGDAKELVTKK